jgi:hypothetical protein
MSFKFVCNASRKNIAIAIAFATCAFAHAQKIEEFAVRAQITPPAGTSLVRAALPAASIAALREADGGDLRVFNAKGVSIPHAIVDASNQAVTVSEATRERFVALPIYAAESVSASTPTLRIEEGPNRRVIEVPLKSATPIAKEARRARGVLFDTRKLVREISGVELEGSLPPSVIVRASIDASNDLKSWQTLASDVPVFEFANNGPSNKKLTFATPKKIEGRYLRITWPEEFAPSVAALRTIEAVSAPNPNASPVRIDVGRPKTLTESYAEWSVASAYRAQALHISTDADNALMPVQVFTRERPGDAWRAVASTVVYRMTAPSGINANPSVRIGASTGNQWRVEPATGYSLNGVPLTLAFEYAPLQIVFVASGEGPFEIATGRANTQTAALPIRTLIPDYKQGAEFNLPLLAANTKDLAVNPASVAAQASASQWLTRSTILWIVLGIAVLVLSAIALSLLRAAPTNKERDFSKVREPNDH